MQRKVDEMPSLGLGEVKAIQIPGNNSKVKQKSVKLLYTCYSTDCKMSALFYLKFLQ